MEKILFFTTDLSESNVQKLIREGYTVRDPRAHRAGDTLEVCDKALGDVPDEYKIFAVEESHSNGATPKTAKELKEALIKAGVDVPEGAKKAELEELYKQLGADEAEEGEKKDDESAS